MKKNLFLLFCIYFFVVQAVIIGIIRQETYMYVLAGVNLIAIVLILILYKAFGLQEDEPQKEKRSAVHEEWRTYRQEVSNVRKIWKKNGSIPTLLGILFAAMIYVLLMGWSFGFKLIVASVIALILLLIICLFSRYRKRFFSLRGTRILLVALALGIIVYWFQFAFQGSEDRVEIGNYIMKDFSSILLFSPWRTVSEDASLLSGEGTVLGTGMTTEALTGDALLSGEQSDLTEEEDKILPTGKSLSMGDMVKYVLESHAIDLITSKDVRFTYVSYSNELYPYFRTAYANALIGSNTNPTKLALCDTYIVMKWLLEDRPVTYTKADVLQKFWDYADEHDVLNGCTQGGVLKDTNL